MKSRAQHYTRIPAKQRGRQERGREKAEVLSLRGVARLMFLNRIGRTVTVLLITLVTFGLAFRSQTLATLGWGAPLFFTWFAVVVAFTNLRPAVVLGRWRWFTGPLALSAAVTGLLGMIGAPVGSSTGYSLGGSLGILIASAPEQWDWFNVTVGQYMLASLRVLLAFTIAAALFAPLLAFKASLGVSNAALGAYGWAAAAAARLWSKYDTRRFRQEQKKKGSHPPAQSMDASEAPGGELQPDADAPVAAVRQTAPASGPHGDHSGHAQKTAETLVLANRPSPGALTPPPRAGAMKAPPVALKNGHDGAHQSPKAPVAPPPANYLWRMPSLNMLKVVPPGGVKQAEIQATSQLIVDTLGQHGIEVSVETVRSGPTVTMYGLKPGWGGSAHDPAAAKRVRVDTILNREKDLALALKSPSLRFEAPVPGEAVVGIEVPNQKPATVTMRSVMDTDEFKRFQTTTALPVPLGLSTGGEPVFTDLTRMPHLLVAGATGSGKSVCINAIITGLLMLRTPYQVRMVMIDPKRVELTPYSGIPHLFTPVVVEPGRAVPILRSLVTEMMERFKVLEAAGVKNIAAFNAKSANKMPYLVIVVDELADLMLTAAGDTERLIVRLAQLGRATGLHLVIATQRPSVDVVTGLIKANFPSRISFAVSSQVDSRTVIDGPGAEKLLGRGDMLFLPVDRPKAQRVQGAFLSDPEIETVVASWKSAGGPELPQLDVVLEEESVPGAGAGDDDDGESVIEKAASLARTQKTLSTSLLQRRLKIGYPRAARLMDELEEQGIVGPGEPGKPRQVLLHT